ncbi:putative RNA-directed DNA polymerase from transposon X-element [Araneus ventricosus]|uniref:Putative RNA-directed DNA polymerase from transposon X-element n=1 Tax=Araneus ventricosus TaxID=182803 RepID=A0A4Y2BQS0_ARAVE|nr:putative RNA-directed DNA polymerase from transposon X-element [Araneus ventricosus]
MDSSWIFCMEFSLYGCAERQSINFKTCQILPYNSPSEMFELEKALSKSRNTSPGPDRISYRMLRHLSTFSLSHILRLFNRVWTEGIFPMQWQEALVVPILKPGKEPKDSSNYRPIALTSCFSKTLERMVNARLVQQLEVNNLLSLHQSGFRKGRSTLDNILQLESEIRNAFVRRNHLVSIFKDIEKAYDQTWRFGILRALFEFGFRGQLLLFIKNVLSHRVFKIRIGSMLSDPFVQLEGVPQGSFLSATLFTIHFPEFF